MKIRVLITGASGYVGGRMAQFLARKSDYEVLLGSRRKTGFSASVPSSDVVQLEWRSQQQLIESCGGIDAIIHLAGMNAQDCAKDSVAALEVNAVATARLVRAAARQRVSRFIYFSTAHVYHHLLTGFIDEQTCPVNLHPYASSNRAAEDTVLAAHQCGDLDGACVVRLSNAYGAPVSGNTDCWTLLVNDLCRQAVEKRSLVLRSPGVQRRDFVGLLDVCRATEHLLQLPKTQLGDGLFNVGGSWSPTVFEVALLIAERCRLVLGFAPKISRPEPAPGAVTEPLDYGIDKLKHTGFQLHGDIHTEIDATLTFCANAFHQEACDHG